MKKEFLHRPRLFQNQEEKDECITWLAWLKAGVFPQGRRSLQTLLGDKYCCLGVGCVITISEEKLELNPDYDGAIIAGDMPHRQKHAPKWLVLIDEDIKQRTGDVDSLAAMNDDGVEHTEIADFVLEVYGDELYNLGDYSEL